MSTNLTTYLIFDTTAREAMEFYQSVLGGKLDVMTFGDMGATGPTPPPEGVMHALAQMLGELISRCALITLMYQSASEAAHSNDEHADIVKAGKQSEIHIYPGVDHAFFNNDNTAAYDKTAADDAWRRALRDVTIADLAAMVGDDYPTDALGAVRTWFGTTAGG